MKSTSKQKTDSFGAVSDDGYTYTLEIWTTIHKWNDSNGGGRTNGPNEIRTDDGKHVNRLNKGEYEIVGEGVRLRSDAMNAA